MSNAFSLPDLAALDIQGVAHDAAAQPRISSLPLAKDMSHHLNLLSKSRQMSSLKELYKYATTPGMIPMGGGQWSFGMCSWSQKLIFKGIPSPEVFPFEELSAQILSVNHQPLNPPRKPVKQKASLLNWLFGSSNETISIPKYVKDAKPTTVMLATSLQYQSATGPPALPLFLREYVQKVFRPAYADWDVLINCGNTDGWGKIVFMLMERNDAILVEEWTYPGAENSYIPLNIENVPLKMDGEGVIPEYMDEVLANWDEEKRGKRRPRVFYTVSVGQNPTGATMSTERKQKVYDVCQKYDVIICEDEPYCTLYTGRWIPQSKQSSISALEQRQIDAETKEGKEGEEAWLAAMPASYLHLDTEGRVIRMDTFSKTSCPGSRLGWITTSPIFIERLQRATEASTQAPSGFVTALTTTMLSHWGMTGYIRWLRGIKATYRMRRDWICDAFEDTFHLEFEDSSLGVKTNDAVLEVFDGLGRGVTCYAKPGAGTVEAKWDEKRGLTSKRGPALVSFIPPTAGMFIWLAVHINQHPDYVALQRQGEDATRVLMDQLWKECAENLVLFAPGWGFDAGGVHNIGGNGTGYFRLSYSITTYEQTRAAIETFSKVLHSFYRLK